MLARKALAGTAGAPRVYVEDVFSCFLYTGTGATNTISNSIDLSGEGGLVWTKSRSAVGNHNFYDTVRGAGKPLLSNTTDAEFAYASGRVEPFNSNGFTVGTSSGVNASGTTYASWTFRKAKKFFDVVTYTGNGNNNRAISHNLGSAPGCVIIKSTSNAQNWPVFHRSTGANTIFWLNATNANTSNTGYFPTAPDSTSFYVGTDTDVNQNGYTYVAYLFAHDAGGFGDAGSDNVISCGSLTTGSSGYTSVNLGYEPQWVMVKTSAVAGSWIIVDNMRGLPVTGNSPSLSANNSNAEDTARNDSLRPTATGFDINADFYGSSRAFIYIAIRRGPMKTPTSGTSVFYPKVHAGTSSYSVGFPTDLCLAADQSGNALNTVAVYRLAGNNAYLGGTASTAAEVSVSVCQFNLQNSFQLSYNSNNQARWHFRRAPGFFDVVCYTGTGSQRTVSHNLGVVPELIIVKSRNDANDWAVYSSAIGNTKNLRLNTTAAESSALDLWASTTPSATTFTVTGTFNIVNGSTVTYVAYLFASVSGVSKVGSYTGNGSSVTVTTDFQPRFIMVKRTDSTGNWIVGDSARGLVSADEPALFLNSTAAETTGQDWVDVSSTGFTVNETALNANVNTATYLYLAVA